MSKTPAISPAEDVPVAVEIIQRPIYLIRGQKVMLDSDLAELYQVLTKNLELATRRNAKRFPEDFMFQLTEEEAESLRFQIGESQSGTQWPPLLALCLHRAWRRHALLGAQGINIVADEIDRFEKPAPLPPSRSGLRTNYK